MIGWPENAFVGQMVVAIKTGYVQPAHLPKLPSFDARRPYRIADIRPWKHGLMFYIEGMPTGWMIPDGSGEWGWDAKSFRPVQTRDTSAQVEALKRLALGVHDEVRA